MLKNNLITILFWHFPCNDRLWEWQPVTSELLTWLLQHIDSAARLEKLLTKNGIVITAGPAFIYPTHHFSPSLLPELHLIRAHSLALQMWEFISLLAVWVEQRLLANFYYVVAQQKQSGNLSSNDACSLAVACRWCTLPLQHWQQRATGFSRPPHLSEQEDTGKVYLSTNKLYKNRR